jgi:hypothetical protein
MTVNPPCVWLHRYHGVPIATGDREIARTVVLLWLQRHAKSNNVLRACNGALGSPAAVAADQELGLSSKVRAGAALS